jgi:polar amino acid transport system substrate-binding protein
MTPRNVATTLLLVLALTLVGCPPSRRFTSIEPAAPLRVGVTTHLPPMVFTQGTEIVGVEADFAHALGRALGRSVEFVEVEWEDQIPALLGHRTDIIMSSMSITLARQVRIAFSDSYLASGLMALIPRRDKQKYDSKEKVLATSADVGVRRGTTGEQFVGEQMDHAAPIPYLTHKDALFDLTRRRIGLFIDDAPLIAWLASEHDADLTLVREPLNREPLGWGMRREDTVLRGTVNNLIERWRKDGTIDAVIRRWLPMYPGLEENRDSYHG